jgi:transcription termination/antitermination protein NusG
VTNLTEEIQRVSDEPNKAAEDPLTATTDGSLSGGDGAPGAGNGRDNRSAADEPVVQESLAADAAGAEELAEEADSAEIVPVEQKPLARTSLTGSEDEKAKKQAEEGPIQMDWYILKVQSNRERSVADALRRKVAIEGLDKYVGEIIVPTEKVTEFKGGKKKVVERKLYPGYIVVHMHINDDTWFAVRETTGIGDFTGAGGRPSPMLPHEVARIIQTEEEESDEAPKLDIKFKSGDRVKVKEGTFEGFEGEVSAIDPQSGKITVMINIFGRSTPVELEYWQVEGV